MSIYSQVFQLLHQPMLIMSQNELDVRIVDANQAFLRLSGYTLEELQSKNGRYLLQKYNIDTTIQVVKSEVILQTKLNQQISVRVDQQPLPACPEDGCTCSFVIFENLTPYKWIEQQAEKNKVLISGIVDRQQHIRFLRDSLAPLLFEPDQKMQNETLMQFIDDSEHVKIMKIIQETYLLKKERSLTLKTSKLSGIELELSVTFAPIVDGFGEAHEFAFVIWDLKPVDDQIDASLKLRIWMAKRDMTAGHLSTVTGISIQTISKLRNGKIVKPQRLTAELIASELQVDVQEIWSEVRK
ncbi:DNA-binding Xre family transcriptional regulator [Paenibacillus endophyticus]|uniref:DNA-binding Xre family transcriptional regulator n=1 Tax=Paenibacillus endophyticus TaxID=1294268 RepID=A0A7W5G8H2_9BACL|nr:helix-turn-helix domain-containing protein [Paenibacillus endophyticus]MBB3151089.1 DNA-binding Xre family transcriptional regulator [Paenibacillus endophyticus]